MIIISIIILLCYITINRYQLIWAFKQALATRQIVKEGNNNANLAMHKHTLAKRLDIHINNIQFSKGRHGVQMLREIKR